MPNIEIHGLPRDDARKLRRKVFCVFTGSSYVDEMIVTIFSTDAQDKDEKPQPYFRLVNDCQEHINEIVERLSSFSMDIEHLQLEKFYPKKLFCREAGCNGELDTENQLTAQDGFAVERETSVCACIKCRRIYHMTGEPFFIFGVGGRHFLSKDGKEIEYRTG